MRFKRLGAVSLAAALMATSTAIVASADDYKLDGALTYSDFAIQIYGMGTTNWSWVNGANASLDDTGAASITSNTSTLNPKDDAEVQFGVQFFINKENGELAELEIGDSYSVKVTYKITGSKGTIKEGTIELKKDIVKDQYNPGVDAATYILQETISKDDLAAYGDVTATVSVSEFKYVKGGKAGEVTAPTASAEETTAAAEETTAAAEETKAEETTAAAETTTADDAAQALEAVNQFVDALFGEADPALAENIKKIIAGNAAGLISDEDATAQFEALYQTNKDTFDAVEAELEAFLSEELGLDIDFDALDEAADEEDELDDEDDDDEDDDIDEDLDDDADDELEDDDEALDDDAEEDLVEETEDTVEEEVAAEPNWVGAAEGSGTPELAKWISFEKLGGNQNKPMLLLCSEDDVAEPPADSELSFKVSDIYGFTIYAQIDQTAWDSWHGGQIGTNSALGGWATLCDYSAGNDLGNLTIDVDAGTFTYKSDTPLFAQEEQDMGGYAQLWLMDWSNGDDAVKAVGFDLLDKDGNVMSFSSAAEAEDTSVVVVEEEVVTTGDVEAATDSTKGSPDTGIEDVAAVAGLAVLAAGAVVLAKKRK